MISIESIGKTFGSVKAVQNVSFSVRPGEILGFLGPNGAGKSTTMKIITGFLEPDYGDVKLEGDSILHNSTIIKSRIGYMPENAPLYEDLSVLEFLKFSAEMRADRILHVNKVGSLDTAVRRVIDICHLDGYEARLIQNLSKGYRRRTSMAQSLLHDPDVLVMDEPTDGLDPNQKFEVRNLIKELSQTKSIVLSTHILEEVESICNRVIVISEGQIVYEGDPQDLKSKSSSGKIEDVFRAMTTKDQVEGVTL